jgi:hypothetical protein
MHPSRSLADAGITMRTVGDLDDAVRAIEDRDRPLLLDVRLDPHAMTRPER